MPTFDNDAIITWLGKPNLFPEGTDPWKRTEIVRKCSGQTVSKVLAKHGAQLKPSTLATLVGKRLISIEGYRGRATSEEMEALQDALYAIVEEQQPMTVRQVFYQATVRGLVEKEETGYDKVQTVLAKMRRDEKLPWEWIVDNTRDRNHPLTFKDVPEALEYIADRYRKELWNDGKAYVEVWLEKDALAGVIEDVTRKYDVSLMVARGYSSVTFLYDAAQVLEGKTCPVHIYHLGDYDPSGVDAGEKIEEFLEEYAPTADIRFTRLAVTEEQIAQWRLPTRPTKRSDSRAEKFGSDVSVELDAIEPRQLRALVERAIKRHMPAKRYEELMAMEKSEQQKIRELIDQIIEDSALTGDDDSA